MSPVPWLGRRERPEGRHAAPSRGRVAPPPPTASPSTAPAPRSSAAPSPDADGTPPPSTPPPSMPLSAPVAEPTAPPAPPAPPAAAMFPAEPPATVPPGAAPLLTLDALGRKCPIPIIMLAEQIRDVPVGSVIAVLADDPAAYTDIPAWCTLKSHECVFRAGYADGWSIGVRRSY